MDLKNGANPFFNWFSGKKIKGEGATIVYSLIALILKNHSISNVFANMIVNIVAEEEALALIKPTVQAPETVRPSNEPIQSISSIYLVTILDLIK